MTQIPALLVSTAAGIVVTKGGMEGSADAALIRQLGGSPKPLAMAAGAATVLALLPGLPTLPFLALAGLAGGGAWLRHKHPTAIGAGAAPRADRADRAADQRIAAHRHDPLELGYGLLALAGGDTPRLTEQIKGLRRVHRRRDGLRAAAGAHPGQHAACRPTPTSIRIKEIEAGKGELRPTMLLAMDPKGGVPDLPGETTRNRRSACRRCGSIRRRRRRRCSAAAPWSIRRAC